mgnify:CR=1 FL=1
MDFRKLFWNIVWDYYFILFNNEFVKYDKLFYIGVRMKVQIRINSGFVSEGGRGSVWKTVKLNEEQVNEFDLKRRTINEEMSLEEFICEDISELVQNEIDNGLYGMFNC